MPQTYAVGIEIEILLTPKAQTPWLDTIEGLAERLCLSYNKITIPEKHGMHHEIGGSYDRKPNATEWTITEDCSVDCDTLDQRKFVVLSILILSWIVHVLKIK